MPHIGTIAPPGTPRTSIAPPGIACIGVTPQPGTEGIQTAKQRGGSPGRLMALQRHPPDSPTIELDDRSRGHDYLWRASSKSEGAALTAHFRARFVSKYTMRFTNWIRIGRIGALFLCFLAVLAGCMRTYPPFRALVPLDAAALTSKTDVVIASPASIHVSGSPRFREVGEAAGLNYRWTVSGKRPLNILQTIGNGCAFLDYNNDGCLDILLVGPKLALYKGDGYGHFTDVTHETGLDRFHGHFLGCCVGDFDNDGYDDIYVSGYHTGLLLHNETGKGSSRVFRDVTTAMGQIGRAH